MSLDFKKQGGLVPAIVVEDSTGDVLMLAYMNEEAYLRTIETGQAHYYSRSRNELWHKGATSGAYQTVKSLYTDCDKDTVLLRVEQLTGAACHTGAHSCFFNKII
ncbi:MAG: phosphoribosyl-AMP cyclohydrolase [Lactobacillales bacterium]|jgi:phosphoribosyl-AMP cyclohydrolase|nr:phosphoribosyl-AMP cyclohydrolase [Lactobacillales bacterium]